MKISILIACLISLSFLTACNSGTETGTKDSIDSAQKVNDSSSKKTDSVSANVAQPPVDNMTTDFAIKAASGGMMEVQLGKIAQEKAVSQRVKNFGAMMVQDHTQANNDLKSRATAQNIALPAVPGAEEQQMIDHLNKKSGKDFDRSYMMMMLEDHKKDIAEFKNVINKCNNPSIKDFATQSLPILQKHLDSAEAITGKN
jgi:putative membrane protein